MNGREKSMESFGNTFKSAEKGTRFGMFFRASKKVVFDHFCLHFALKTAFFTQMGYLKRGQDLGCFFPTSKRGRDLGSEKKQKN
jgi:hypothetical protein